MFFDDPHTLMTQENRNSFNRYTGKQEFDRKSIAETMCVAGRHPSQNDEPLQTALPIPPALFGFDNPVQKK